MREGYLNQFDVTATRRCSMVARNSFVRDILRVSCCGSRFCPESTAPRDHNFYGINILEETIKKI
jgi:hypothetical protein